MSIKCMLRVWEQSQHNGSTLLALLSLADRADDSGFCWPSHSDTAHRARVTRTYVASTIIPKLVETAELYQHKVRGKSNRYIVTLGLTAGEIAQTMKNRLNYDDQTIAEKLTQLAKQATQTQETQVVQTLNLFKDLTGVLKVLTGDVNQGEHEPSITIKGTVNPGSAKQPKNQKPKTKYMEESELMEKVFAEARGCNLPDWDNGNPRGLMKTWRQPLNRILTQCNGNLDNACFAIAVTVKKMLDENLTFSIPAQIEKTAQSVIIDLKRESGSKTYVNA